MEVKLACTELNVDCQYRKLENAKEKDEEYFFKLYGIYLNKCG